MARKVRCTVAAIDNHGHRVYTVALTPASPVPAFRPGHFLHLTVDDFDPSGFWPESRVFSIASASSDRTTLRICYSVQGRYTEKMEQSLRVGGDVWVKLPYGDFVIDETTPEAVLIAGGTGISAFAAFVDALTPGRQQRVTLVYGVRAEELVLFREMLLARQQQVPDLQVVFFVERRRADSSLEALDGRIDLAQVWPRLADAANAVFYIAGPPAMHSTLRQELVSRGVTADRIREDAWE